MKLLLIIILLILIVKYGIKGLLMMLKGVIEWLIGLIK